MPKNKHAKLHPLSASITVVKNRNGKNEAPLIVNLNMRCNLHVVNSSKEEKFLELGNRFIFILE